MADDSRDAGQGPGEPEIIDVQPLRVSPPRPVEVDIEEAEFVEEFPSVYDELYGAGGAAGVAGLPVAPAAPRAVPGAYQAPLTPLEAWHEGRRKRRLTVGMGLIAVGVVLFVLLLLDVSLFGVLLAAAGAFVLALAARWTYYPIVLTGAALTGFGAGWIVDSALDSPAHLSLVGLGAGMLAAYGFQVARHRRPRWGAPVIGLIFVAWGVLAGLSGWWSVLGLIWPLAIVAVGVAVVVSASRRRR